MTNRQFKMLYLSFSGPEHREDWLVRALLDADCVDVNAASQSGRTALDVAAFAGNRKGVRMLLDDKRLDKTSIPRAFKVFDNDST